MRVIDIIILLRNSGYRISVDGSNLRIRKIKEDVKALENSILIDLKEKKQEIVKFLKQQKSKGSDILITEKKEYYPMSSTQRRMWFLQTIEKDNIGYNTIGEVEFKGVVNASEIESRFRQIITRHESFRTAFIKTENGLFQKIYDNILFSIGEYDLIDRDYSSLKEKLIQPFNLEEPPLLRVNLIRVNEDKTILLIENHHIISDGVSNVILEKEFNDLMRGKELPLVKLQYKDYSEWQNSKEQLARIKVQEAYWIEKFKREIPVLNIPTDFVRPAIQSHEGARVSFTLSQEETLLIQTLCKEQGLTLYMSLLSVFTIFLSKISGQDDIIVGSPIAARRHADLDSVVGMFVNTLAMRNIVSGNKILAEYLQELKENTLEAYENQEYQFEDLVEKVLVDRDTSRNPLFDVMFNMLNQIGYRGDLSGFDNSDYIHSLGSSKFDWTLTAVDYGSQLLLSFEYCTKLFKAETIERYINYLKRIIHQIPNKIESKISEIEILSAAEKQQLLYEFNDTKANYPKNKTIHELFEEQVERTPDCIALMLDKECLTYKELNRKANEVSNHLRENGICRDYVVAVFLDRSLETIFSMLGILKAGGAYLPLDPDYPNERINFILNDSNAKSVITTKYFSEIIDFKGYILCIEELLSLSNFRNIKTINTASDLSYIIYTSGTTGKPKGVMVEHRNVVRLFFNDKFQFDFSENDVWTMFHSPCFDFSVWEMYGALLFGGKLVIVPKMVARDVTEYFNVLCKEMVTVLNQTPSSFYNLIELALNKSNNPLENLRYVIFGGEALKSKRLEEWFNVYPNVKLINMFGITETTVHVTYKEIGRYEIENNISNIGTPIPTLTTYVVDKGLKLVPKGVAGELLIGGAGVSRGYLGKDELTRKRFINNLFKKEERIYRSGDLVRMLSNGDMEYLGRIDDQVKIRGFRIELGEIEGYLLKHPLVIDAVVVAREGSGGQYLCSYIVCNSKEINIEKSLRTYLLGSLPDYMVPSYILRIDSIPLTSNGKLDRKSLPEPEIKAGLRYIAPSTFLESKLVKIWSEVLSIPSKEISILNSFFELGGHSLKVTMLGLSIHKELGIHLEFRKLFQNYTIQAQSQLINSSSKSNYLSIPKAKDLDYYALSSSQRRLYILQQIDLDSITYNMPDTIPVPEGFSKSQIEEVFGTLISRHDNFRTSFKVVDELPVQRIHPEVSFSINNYHIKRDELNKLQKDFVRSFDLSQAPLLRAGYVEVEDGYDLLLIDMHHIISDGRSRVILEEEFNLLLAGKELKPLRVQYKDYSEWISNKQQQERIKIQENYWLKKLEGGLPVLNIPIDYIRPAIQSHEGARVGFTLSQEETLLIQTLCREQGLTLYISLLSIFKILLSKLSGQDDIIVGSPIAARRHSDLGGVVGMFVNTLAMRNNVLANKRLNDYLQELKENTLEAYENQDYQFEDLVEKVLIDRDTSHNPLFDVMFNMLNQIEYRGDLSGFDSFDYIHRIGSSKFDLTLTAVDLGNQIHLNFEYSTKLFKSTTIDRFITYFKEIINQLDKGKSSKLSEITILPELERQQLLNEFNNTETPYHKNKTINLLFEEQVKKNPNRIAVISGNNRIDYAELNRRSESLASYLIQNEVHLGSVVGVLMERSIEMIVGIFGILKAGGAYLPISPDYPKDRINYILEDSGANIVLTESKLLNRISSSFNRVKLDDKVLNHTPLKSKTNRAGYNSVAYIIYTSGTTGKPKGVMIEHHSVINRLKWMQREYSLETNDTILQKTPTTFDVSVWELFWWSFEGNSVYMLKPNGEKDPSSIADAIKREKINVLHFVPSMLELFLDYISDYEDISCMSSLNNVFASGEELRASMVDKFYKVFKISDYPSLINLYGPTEVTVDVTHFPCIANKKCVSVPIGKPIDNTKIYILDEEFKIQPIGVTGQLCISGVGVARGYLGKVQLTNKVFVKNPFAVDEHLYLTGDLARWLPDGNIEFLGRNDYQVKIRGLRIELGEIESVLLKAKGVKNCKVLVQGEDKNKEIYAYIVGEGLFNESEVRTELLRKLPEYMVPSVFVKIEEIPLKSNGKVNVKSLLEIKIEKKKSKNLPQSDIEKKIIKIWEHLLQIDELDLNLDSNFFQTGGNSLLAISLSMRLKKEFGVDVPLKLLFSYPSVREVSEYLKNNNIKRSLEITLQEKKEYYTISSAQKRSYIQQQLGLDVGYTVRNLVPVYNIEDEILYSSLKDLVKRHDCFRTYFEEINGEIYQRIKDDITIVLDSIYSKEDDLQDALAHYSNVFNLNETPLFRTGIIKNKSGDKYLLIDMHHIITDQISQEILRKEFDKLLKGEELKKLKLQYKDYSSWQNSCSNKEKVKEQEEYWLKKLDGDIPGLNLPFDYKRNKIDLHKGKIKYFFVREEIYESITTICNDLDVTHFMFIHSIYSIFLSKICMQEEIAIGSPTTGRTHESIVDVVGMFVNLIALRSYPHTEKSFRQHLFEIKKDTIDALENQDYPFEEVIRKTSLKNINDPNILLDSFILTEKKNFKLPQEMELTNRLQFDYGVLILTSTELEDNMMFSFKYRPQVFHDDTIDYFGQTFSDIINCVIENIDIQLRDIKFSQKKGGEKIIDEIGEVHELNVDFDF